MKPTVEAYTVAMPWYEREDFQRLWELARDRDEMPGDYEVWHIAAVKVMTAWLARGRALQIITIRSEALMAWLEVRDLANTAATRLQYIEERAKGTGSETSGVGIAIEHELLPADDLSERTGR